VEFAKGRPNKDIEPLWKRPAHFILRSAEAAMPLPTPEPIDVADLVIEPKKPELTIVPDSEEHIDRGYN
jgi:hypothetical protein